MKVVDDLWNIRNIHADSNDTRNYAQNPDKFSFLHELFPLFLNQLVAAFKANAKSQIVAEPLCWASGIVMYSSTLPTST